MTSIEIVNVLGEKVYSSPTSAPLSMTNNVEIDLSKQDDELDAVACGLAYCYLNRNHLLKEK